MRRALIFLFVWVSQLCAAAAPTASTLESVFHNPPEAARPWVFWYWMNGAVSREGITADMEAMERAGIGGAYLFTVGAPKNPPAFTPVVKPLTPEWWAMVRHAASEAERCHLKLGLAIGDGFATAGGPWITPDLTMQKLVWSETTIDGAHGETIETSLAQPPTNEGFYRDVAVVAFPLQNDFEEASSADRPVVVSTKFPDVDPAFLAHGGDGEKQLRANQAGWIQYDFLKPFTARSLVVRQWPRNYGGVYQATRLRIEASDDGKTFHEVTRLEPPRHGWQDWDADYTFALSAVTARYFRFVYDPSGSEAGAEDLDGAKWKPKLVLRGLVLSSEPRIDGFEGKSGAVWRLSSKINEVARDPKFYVPQKSIVDLTDRLSRNGRLAWSPPPGRWKVMRFGYTPTGHQNETATSALGLECDKLSAAAVRVQFDHWFGETVRQLGPGLAESVLKILHVDSWEAGSQNWTPEFRKEFIRRRGYDPIAMLPAMAGVPLESAEKSEAFLRDIRRTIADLTREKFFGTLRTLAHEHGCTFSAEPTAPTMSGDSMEPFAEVDLPMGEFWLRSPTHDKPTDMADAISAAHIYGKPIVQAESFTELRLQWDEHPGMLKALADHDFALGSNRVVLHVFAHNPWLDRKPGMTLNGVGTYFQRDQTWWPQAKAWTDYLARCSALLQAGRPVADVAYFTGEDLPARAVVPERRSSTLPDGYAADSINADALLRLARREGDTLVLPGGARYRALVLPEAASPDSSALVAKLDEIAGLVVKPGGSIRAYLEQKNVQADVIAFDENGTLAKDFDWTHRSGNGVEIYFLSNQEYHSRQLRFSFREGDGDPELWNPVTGEISRATHAVRRESRCEATIEFAAFASTFVVFQSRQAAEQIPEAVSVFHELSALSEDWSVTFSPELGGPAEPVSFAKLEDWTHRPESQIRFYSGAAMYRREFRTVAHSKKPRVWLDLGDVANMAHVRLNGVDCGTVWTPPYRVEVTSALRAGTNQLEIMVVNTWNNRLVGDQKLPSGKQAVTWTTAPTRPQADLLPSGLIGPVRLLTEP